MFADMDLHCNEVVNTSLQCKEQPCHKNPFIEANKGIIDDYEGQQINLEFYTSVHHWMEELNQGQKYTMLTFDSNLDPVYIQFKFISFFQSENQCILTYRQKWKRRDNVKIITNAPFVLWKNYIPVDDITNYSPLVNLLTQELYLDELNGRSTLNVTA